MITGIENLQAKTSTYLPEEKVHLVNDAFQFAQEKHAGQNRRSGDPYIQHPIKVAEFLAELHLDASTLAAALLHDVVEDCEVPIEELNQRFGTEIARIVDGLTKLTHLNSASGNNLDPDTPRNGTQAENLRKMFVAMAEDIRVVLIKLADRLHNMQTLQHMPASKRIAISQETIDIYAPLAERLGMGQFQWQLEDLAFRYLYPKPYQSISRLLASQKKGREEHVQQVTQVLNQQLNQSNIHAEVTGRTKHLYSIYRKAQTYSLQGKQIGEIYDLFAVRILVSNIQDCYGALGVVHSIWRPLPGEFNDYIANPKANMYQSLHTTVRGATGVPIEIQVRTYEMHQVAEYGVAAHWRYKEGYVAKDMRFEEKLAWLRQLLDWQREFSGADEFLETVKTDIFRDQVFVYTPKSEIKELPSGSTPIDFAYHIHTDLGHRCIGAKVNDRMVSLDYQLRNGDTIQIITSKVARGPSFDWLNSHLGYIKTATARQRIRSWFRRQERSTHITRGKGLMKKELRRLNTLVDEQTLVNLFKQDTVEDVYVAIGSGLISINQIGYRLANTQAPKLTEDMLVELPRTQPSDAVQVLGVGDIFTRLAVCCQPVPGDEITGYITRIRGVTIHRVDCSNIRKVAERDRLIQVSWGRTKDLFPVQLLLEAWDRVGLLRDITTAISTEGISISSTSTKVQDRGTVKSYITVQVATIGQLSQLFTRIEGIRGVTSVFRVNKKERLRNFKVFPNSVPPNQ